MILDLRGYSVIPGIVGMHDHLWYLARPNLAADNSYDPPGLLRREMDLERAFVAARGLLLAGPDPVGVNGLVPGFSDQREIELLVEAGFAPVQAIRIATLNGATFLGREAQIGSIAVGKNADFVIVKGDPATRIEDIEHVEIVFKDGAGYDTRTLLDSASDRKSIAAASPNAGILQLFSDRPQRI